MTQEQVLEQLKLLLPALGMLLASLGIGTSSENATIVTQVMSVIGPAMILGGSVWGVLDKRQKSLIEKVDTIAKDPNSPVQGVIMAPTTEGKELANSIPGNTTVVAGTIQATNIANNQ